ncbi:MAG TPA: FhaA domain-containing protein [Candidatus Sulfotelmatobacter sp.]|nr:FhaA domain-containing protein [Candidatus Sulfotelmatobacter sp.]
MNVFARIENVCARVVEDAFARVFPSALDPAQIGRRLVATAQSVHGDLYLVRVHPTDYARLAADRDFLEGRWGAMLREVLPDQTPRVVLDEDAAVVAGSLAIEPVSDERGPVLALLRGDGSRVTLGDGMTLGRGEDCGLVLRDPRVSRRHAKIVADGAGWAIEDLRSSNGTWIEGTRVARARLVDGQTVTLGDTLLRVVDVS